MDADFFLVQFFESGAFVPPSGVRIRHHHHASLAGFGHKGFKVFKGAVIGVARDVDRDVARRWRRGTASARRLDVAEHQRRDERHDEADVDRPRGGSPSGGGTYVWTQGGACARGAEVGVQPGPEVDDARPSACEEREERDERGERDSHVSSTRERGRGHGFLRRRTIRP